MDAIIEAIEANPGLVLVTLRRSPIWPSAPARKPGIAARIGRCVVIGGASCFEGNVTPAAEYNIWVDPEVARIVLLSGIPIELIGWQLWRGEAVPHEEDIVLIQGFKNELAHFAIECNSHAACAQRSDRRRRYSLPDPVAMCIASTQCRN